MKPIPGTVYLVGAGPGDPGLITVKGRACIEKADVVIYDYLAAPALLAHARQDAETIYVGKKGGDHTLSQDGINRLITEKAQKGLTVTRLKGGDPFIFGRGGEEAEELVAAGIPFEIVPGVTSAIAAPAYAGIPLTHRDHTSTVAFVTGHEDPTRQESRIDWASLARGTGTIVFLMGVKNLPHIVDQLVAAGKDPVTPAALIRWGTRFDQVTVAGTLSNIVEKVKTAGLKAPAIIVVGDVVGLRKKLKWFENRPLFGKTVVVTRARKQASGLVDRLADLGAHCLEFPTIRIAPPADPTRLDAALTRLDQYDWIVFTSVNGVERFFDRLLTEGLDTRALGHMCTVAIGPVTSKQMRRYGLMCDIVPETYRAESVVKAFAGQDIAGQKVLLPRASQARPVIPLELEKMGALVDEVPVYDTEAVSDDAAPMLKKLEGGEIDLITFTSSSTVRNFVSILPPDRAAELLKGVTLASIGPITTQTAAELGLEATVTADTYTIPGLCDAIVAYYAGHGSDG